MTPWGSCGGQFTVFRICLRLTAILVIGDDGNTYHFNHGDEYVLRILEPEFASLISYPKCPYTSL